MTTERPDNIIQFPRETIADIEAAAATWLARTTSGSLTLGELAEFEFWRAASSDHDRIYREMEYLWNGLETTTIRRGLNMPGARSHPSHRSPRWGLQLGWIAATVVIILLSVQYLSVWRYDYYAAPGQFRRVILADGSTVTMKGGTAINTQVSGTGPRTIELASGEAFFDVRHDPSRPFTVDAGNGVVRDVGTGFSVARVGPSSTVAVEHGVVEVLAGGSSEMLTKGEQTSFNLYTIERKRPVDTNMISAWRRGIYIAEGEPLGDVLSNLDEYHPGRIVVVSRTLAARRVNAIVQFGHIDAWLDALSKTKGVSVRRWGPLTIVSDRPS